MLFINIEHFDILYASSRLNNDLNLKCSRHLIAFKRLENLAPRFIFPRNLKAFVCMNLWIQEVYKINCETNFVQIFANGKVKSNWEIKITKLNSNIIEVILREYYENRTNINTIIFLLARNTKIYFFDTYLGRYQI